MIHSLQDWWSLAGVELDYTDHPGALLAAAKAAPAPEVPQAAAVTEPVPEAVKIPAQNERLPASYPEFVDWLASDEDLIESSWSNQRVAPQGVLEPEVMVVSALPEKNRNGEVQLFNPENRKLLEKMLAAIGCDSHQFYLANIATSLPYDGRIDEQHWPTLKTRFLHHVGLVRPNRVICFGDLAAKIIFGQDLLTARKNKQFINHSSSQTEAIVTFHPRILIERPLFKAEAWKDLQMLTRISAS
ncbi:uracil-DNA glycosylase family protein [Sphingorhabdus sp. SMR4y]|uniref:uracil-DNA glycosylase family protein n=1 Tax=Sphingorhabdus sp. SMR4y TaxID=2584094 RepID=UPI000B611B78|nr:uracil-DNA glycosylase family protein [Sphingorhabdus sp. SMR4y]ASK87625.1 Uracil DNA glycosylase superfamily protein [Sphingorhabdus sp. SMR4y]